MVDPIITWQTLYTLLRQTMPSAFEAEQLFTHVTGWHSHDLPRLTHQPVPPDQLRRLRRLMERRQEGEPLQYLLGEWEFYGLPFKVGEGVLIPRADTEVLVDVALEKIGNNPRPKILDLCTGSGAVAIALAHHVPAAEVAALELSAAAFAYLEENIRRNGGKVQAIHGDVFAYEPPVPQDLITANPPYIPTGELSDLQKEVQQEPAMALDGGPDGLSFYREITKRYTLFLASSGILCFEVGMGQAGVVAEIMRRNGLAAITVHKDLAGIDRVVAGARTCVPSRHF